MRQEASGPQVGCPCPEEGAALLEEQTCDSLPAPAASSASSSSAVVVVVVAKMQNKVV